MKFIFALLRNLGLKYNIELKALKKMGKKEKGLKLPARERLVIVSNSIQVLAMIETMFNAQNEFKYLKLEGRTSPNERQQNIANFNSLKQDYHVFLLCSKSGGVGIGFTAANHLILFEPDWNPANDELAMGRIWRQGQTKPFYIYRLFCTGTIEEVIFKRQQSKKELEKYIRESQFDKYEVLPEGSKELYIYYPKTLSKIHESIKCTKDECANILTLNETKKATAIDEDEEMQEENDDDDDVEEVFNISAISKWNHYYKAGDIIKSNDVELGQLYKIWNHCEPANNVGLSFAFHKKIDTSSRVPINDAGGAIDVILKLDPDLQSANQ